MSETIPSISNDGIHPEFDGDVQYPYADVGAPKLLHISSVTNENRRCYNYTCPYCKKDLLPKLGTKRRHCFSHKKGERCDIDKYIHSTAEKLLKEKWDSDEPFNISMAVHKVCKYLDTCKFNKLGIYTTCGTETYETFDLKKWYTECLVEKKVGDFIPDLCLIDSTGQHEPIFIEIWSKHKSSDEKIASNNKIIEIRLKTVNELEWLTQKTIIESDSVSFYNFDVLKIDPKDIEDRIQLIKYTLFSPSLKSHLDNGRVVTCYNYNYHHPKAVLEIVGITFQNYSLSSFWNYCNNVALEKGYNVKACQLCQIYDSKERGCRREYREKGIIIPCNQEEAKTCEQFKLKDKLYKISKMYMSGNILIMWERKPDGKVVESIQGQIY